MIQFNFPLFEQKERISRSMLAEKTGLPKSTVVAFWERGSLKPETLQLIEKKTKKKLDEFIVPAVRTQVIFKTHKIRTHETKPTKKGIHNERRKNKTSKASR